MRRNLVKFEQLLARGSAASSGRPRSSSQSGSGPGGEEEEDEEEEESTDSSSDDEGASEYVITGKFGAMKITGGGLKIEAEAGERVGRRYKDYGPICQSRVGRLVRWQSAGASG